MSRGLGDVYKRQEWTLLRLDADYLFNNDYQGPDVWDETLNFINVSLADWY